MAPVLRYARLGEKFIVDMHVSNVGTGTVLSQVQVSQKQVMAYYSHTLSGFVRNYCATPPESLAVVKMLEHLHRYL
jgi:hypothetical protein